MQIHELNNYNGNLDQSSYLAVDNGSDTGKVSITELLENTNASVSQLDAFLNGRIDNIIAGGEAPSASEIVDARYGANGVTYPSLGDAIRDQVNDLKSDLTSETNARANADNALSARISNNDGAILALQTDTANLGTHKVAQPLDGNNQPTNGTSGQLLRTKGNGSTEWVDVGLPTDAQTEQAISDWLDAHPEATTTVQDGSLTEIKFSDGLKKKAIKDYVTPEMFGAVGDGTADDTQSFNDMFASNMNSIALMPNKTYRISGDLSACSNKVINLNGSTIRTEKSIELLDNNILFNGVIQCYNNARFIFQVSISGNCNIVENVYFTSNVTGSHCVATHKDSVHTIIRNCRFDGNAKIGVNVCGTDCVIDGCYFESTIDSTLYSNGVKCSSDNSIDYETHCARNTKIVNCHFDRLNDNCIDCFSGADGLIVENCIFNNDDVVAIEIKNIFRSPEDTDYSMGFSVPELRICRDIHIENCEFNGTQYIFVASVLVEKHYSGDITNVSNITCKNCIAPNINKMVFATNELVENVVIDNLICYGLTDVQYQYAYGKRMVFNNINNAHLALNIYGEVTVQNSKLNKISIIGSDSVAHIVNCETHQTTGSMIEYTAGNKVIIEQCNALSCSYVLGLLKECPMIIIRNCLGKMMINNGYAESGGNVYIMNNLYVQKISPSDNNTGIVFNTGNSIMY